MAISIQIFVKILHMAYDVFFASKFRYFPTCADETESLTLSNIESITIVWCRVHTVNRVYQPSNRDIMLTSVWK